MSGKKIFSLLDLKDGFNHIEMDEKSITSTSFVTPHGQFEYIRMPFGLKNVPANFQRFVYNIFRGLIDFREIVVYIDDILIASEDIDSYLRILANVLCRCYEKGLKLKIKKFKFGYNEIEYLHCQLSWNTTH